MDKLTTSLQTTIRSMESITRALRAENNSLRRRITTIAALNIKLRAELDELKKGPTDEG